MIIANKMHVFMILPRDNLLLFTSASEDQRSLTRSTECAAITNAHALLVSGQAQTGPFGNFLHKEESQLDTENDGARSWRRWLALTCRATHLQHKGSQTRTTR